MMGLFATDEEMEYTIAMATNGLRLLVADAMTCALYKDHKVSINLRNVEGEIEQHAEVFHVLPLTLNVLIN